MDRAQTAYYNSQQIARRRLCMLMVSVVGVVVVIVGIGGMLLALLGQDRRNPDSTSEMAASNQDGQGTLSLTIDGVSYIDGQSIQLEQGEHFLQCQTINTNPDSTIQFNGGSRFGVTTPPSTSTISHTDGFLHDLFTSLRVERNANIGSLTCSVGSNFVSVLVSVQRTTLPPIANPIQDINIRIDGAPALNGDLITTESGTHLLRCTVLSSRQDLVIEWDLFGIEQKGQPIREDISYRTDDGLFSYESIYINDLAPVDIFRMESYVRCAAIAGNNQVTLETQIQIEFQVELPTLDIDIDAVRYASGQDIILEEGSHTFTCSGTSDTGVQWLLDGSLISQSVTFTREFDRYDCGKTLICETRDGSISSTVHVNIITPPSSAIISISSEGNIDGTYIRVNDTVNVIVQCTVTGGNKQPSVTWSIGGRVAQTFEGSEGFSSCSDQSVVQTFSFTASRSEHHGKEIVCTAGDGVENRLTIDVIPAGCEPLPPPKNGAISSEDSDFSLGTILTFSCSKEYVLMGDTQITCQNDGVWSGSVPRCAAGCGEPLPPPENCAISPADSDFSLGTILTFSCSNEYVRMGDTQITCQNDGIWSGPIPRCVRVRLVDGTNSREGRVEVYHDGEWGTIDFDNEDPHDGHPVCRELGYLGALEFREDAAFGEGSGRIWLNDIDCGGIDSSVFDCGRSPFGVVSSQHIDDDGVVCDEGIRLVGGRDDREGRVEVLHNGIWGTVCNTNWDMEDANLICRRVGFLVAESAFPAAYFGRGSGPIWLDNVGCTGTAIKLSDCSNLGWGIHNCAHKNDAGVRCAEVPEGSLKLEGGSNYKEGRVEMYYFGGWGTVCDDRWDIDDARVVCRQLGFQSAVQAVGLAHFGEGTGHIILDDMVCIGDEPSLRDCIDHTGYGDIGCDHREDAGVICN